MSKTTDTPETPNDGTGVTVIQVPEAYAQKVIEYVQSLQQDADVTGYAISRTEFSGSGTGTGCIWTGLISGFTDYSCADSDR